MDPIRVIRAHGIVPVLGLKNPDTAPQVAAALQAGGLPLLEVTLRAPKALDCLKAIKAAYPDMLVGAGTILSTEQADAAIAAGADFLVAPGFNPKVVQRSLDAGIPMVPGCVTASEIEAAMELGLRTFKFFPAEPMNGLAVIKQLCGPYKGIDFVPTAGINLQNLPTYLGYDRIAAVGGSFMAPASMIDEEDWAGITALCKEAVSRSLGFRLVHVGINGKSKEEGMAVAQWFADRFGFPVKPGEKSNFAGTAVECCNEPFPGTVGHIAIGTLSPERAMNWFRAKGVPMREDWKTYDASGNLVAAYLEEEICGFAVHIVKA